MRLKACIAGVGMTRFMKYPDKGLKELGTQAAAAALADAGLEIGDLEAAYVGNCAAAAVVVSERKARELGLAQPVRVVTSVMHSGYHHGEEEPDTVELCAREAYEEAGPGPERGRQEGQRRRGDGGDDPEEVRTGRARCANATK